MRFLGIARILPALSLLISVSAPASETPFACPNIRLDQKGGPVEPLPVYDQQDHDVCYAIVASELVDAYRFSDPSADRKHLTSVLVAGAYFSGKYRAALNAMNGVKSTNGIDLGSVSLAVSCLREKGSCDQNQLFRSPDAVGIDRNLSDPESILDSWQKKSSTGQDPSSEVPCLRFSKMGLSDNLVMFSDDLRQVFSSSKFYSTLDGFLTEVCKPFTTSLADLPPPKHVKFSPSTQKESEIRQTFANALSETLGSPTAPQPVAVGLCRQVLIPPMQSNQLNSACTQHSVLIVGSTPTPSGGCLVLVRDSAGPKCDPKVPWSCDKEKPGEYWLPVEKLVPKTLELTYFVKP